jgi:EmrB/QacA subfamily drug resistance transporter
VSTDVLDRPTVPVQLTKTRINLIFITILVGMLLSALDQTIVSTALPSIVGDLGGSGHMSWVVTAYLLAETISTVVAGKFGDMFGRKRVFQVSVVVFIVGSFFAGLSFNMDMLIAMRALQGLGGGALAVTATALIGEVIPLRDRGKYQGALGAVFGVTTVIGPLLGGVFTDQLSWRWAFYINVPIAIIVIIMAARTIPGLRDRVRATVDYWGVLFVALGATGLTLATSWGGTQYAWNSPVIIGLFVGSAIAIVVFVFVENRAAEPILPMRLFKSRVFAISSVLSFIVGFAMMGALTFLPTFMQFVGGASATESGLRTLPMVIGLLITALLSGSLVGRTGKYRIFPILGSIVTGVGLFLLSLMNADTPIWLESIYLFVLGAGIGLVMQVLTIIVQNTSDFADLGAATSGVTFFRTLGGSFGAALFGSIYGNFLAGSLPTAIAKSGLTDPQKAADPAGLHALPDAVKAPIIAAYADALHNVFLFAVPIAAIALIVALVLPQVKMRGTAADAARDPGAGFAIPESSNEDDQLETLVGRAVRRTDPTTAVQVLRDSGSGLDAAEAWGVLQVFLHGALLERTAGEGSIEDRLGVPHGVLTPFFDGLVDSGYLSRGGPEGDSLTVTETGSAEIRLIFTAWREFIIGQLHEWLPSYDEGDERLNEALQRVVTRLVLEEQQQSAPAVVGS